MLESTSYCSEFFKTRNFIKLSQNQSLKTVLEKLTNLSRRLEDLKNSKENYLKNKEFYDILFDQTPQEQRFLEILEMQKKSKKDL